MRDGWCHSPTLCHPLTSFLHAASLEKEQRRPRGAYDHQPGARPGWRRDARRAEHVLSITSNPVRPSPALCPHPGHCGGIPTLWIPVLMECRHVMPCAAQAPASARPSNWHTGCNQAHVLGELPSKSLPGEYKASTTSARTRIHQDALGSQALCIGTTALCKNPCGMPVSRIPLVYKRRRRTPGCRGTTFIRILPRTIAPLILALASII
jgi:hypothetical protein